MLHILKCFQLLPRWTRLSLDSFSEYDIYCLIGGKWKDTDEEKAMQTHNVMHSTDRGVPHSGSSIVPASRRSARVHTLPLQAEQLIIAYCSRAVDYVCKPAGSSAAACTSAGSQWLC